MHYTLISVLIAYADKRKIKNLATKKPPVNRKSKKRK